MASSGAEAAGGTTLAGGTVLGAFGYASMGAEGWHVTRRRDVGGLTDDAVAEGARLIERLAWWPGEPLVVGTDPYQRPRRLAWLDTGTTPRRFLVHTIHAENDASSRPDNNYTECLVVAPPSTGHPARPRSFPAPGGPRVTTDETRGAPASPRGTRPSELWAVEGWATPWGAEAVARARPGQHSLETPRPGREVVELIVSDPSSLLRLRCLLAAVHRALHGRGPRVVGVVDDLVWGAVLLDTALALLPPAAAWDVTFDLRSLPPAHRFSPAGAPGALVRLHGQAHQKSAVPADYLDLTTDCDEARLAATLSHADDRGCPQCGQWYASIDRLLRQGSGVTPELLDRQVAELGQGLHRLHPLPPGETLPPVATSDRPSAASENAPAAAERDPAPARAGEVSRRPTSSRFASLGRPNPIMSRLGRDLDQGALQEALVVLQDCRDRLVGGPRTVASDRLLRDTWARVRELADSELQQLSEDPAPGAPATAVRGQGSSSRAGQDRFGRRGDSW